MFLLGLLLPLVYIPTLTGFMILTGWCVLSCALPFFFLRGVRMGPGHWLGIAFLAYACVAEAWAPVAVQGVWDLLLMAYCAGMFMLGATYDLKPLYVGLAWGIGINTVIGFAEHFGWHAIVGDPGFDGVFFNPDMFGETATLVTVALVANGLWRLLPLTVIPIYMTGTRAGLVALGAACAIWLWNSYRWRGVAALAILALIASPVIFHKGWDGSIALRVAMWRDTIDGLTIFGHGPGSFFMLYPEFASRTDTMFTRPEDPHNDFLGFIFQYGAGTIPLAVLLALAFCQRQVEKYVLAAYLAISFFSFPWRIPSEAILGMVALGACCRPGTMVWPEWVCRRPTIWAWLCRASIPNIPMESLHPHPAGV